MTRRRWIAAAAVVFAGLVVFVLAWFEPQQLLNDERVTERLPTVTSTAPGGQMGDANGEPIVLRRGSFVSLDHGTEGTVRVVQVEDLSRIVRLEGLDTDNGPDLYLYLSTNAADGAEGAFDDDYVNLGRLKGNLGDQNYELPSGVDLARYRSVVIWCDRFNSAFGAAELA